MIGLQKKIVYLNITDNNVECFGKTKLMTYSASAELPDGLTKWEKDGRIRHIKKMVFEALWAMQKWDIDMNTREGKIESYKKNFPPRVMYPVVPVIEETDSE